jgi:acetolactate synthase-1/2/3 large subunit
MTNPFGILPTRYDKVFEPLGCYTDRVEDPAALRTSLEKAFASGRTAVIDVVVDPTTPHPSPPKAMAASLGWMDPQDLPEQLRAFIPPEVQKGKK